MTAQLNLEKMQYKSNTNRKAISFKKLTSLLAVFIVMLSFNSNAETGEELFKKSCATCHSLTDKVMVGPGLAGLNDRRSEEWSMKWIRNSQELIASGDADAKAVFEEFNSIPMTSFEDLSDEDLKGLLAYIAEAGKVDEVVASAGGGTSAKSGGETENAPTFNPSLIGWFVLIVGIVAFLTFRYTKRIKNNVANMGFHPDAHKVKNFPAIFALYVILAVAIIYILIGLLDNNYGMINSLMFMVLPYAAFTIFIAGSVYRYTKKGFKVSSLSSQFIEGKQLFWGSQPFHWGILILFCGHLIAFLFPSAVTMWNGVPVRRLILEISSFAFGLSALFGLIVLIKRRLTNKSLLVVTNKMDMVVYTVLLIQIVSGLGVAFFVRWGSEWFASVLTPYLRSIFSFNPDITALAEMPWWIQLHVISAFLIIGIIPFTRFMHFLVAPVDYAWRKYQIVVWNWNRKSIRNSRQHTFGKKSRNH
jgi:nitrate reductase gamma subunit